MAGSAPVPPLQHHIRPLSRLEQVHPGGSARVEPGQRVARKCDLAHARNEEPPALSLASSGRRGHSRRGVGLRPVQRERMLSPRRVATVAKDDRGRVVRKLSPPAPFLRRPSRVYRRSKVSIYSRGLAPQGGFSLRRGAAHRASPLARLARRDLPKQDSPLRIHKQAGSPPYNRHG